MNIIFIVFRSSPLCVVAHTNVNKSFLTKLIENIAQRQYANHLEENYQENFNYKIK